MRGLVDLLESADGRQLLESRGVFDDPPSFAEALEPPARPGMIRHLGLEAGTTLVYVGQQVQPDYPGSVTAKFRAARDLSPFSGVEPLILWLDTDRAGAHKGQAAITWPGPGRITRTTRLAPRRWKELEVRFVPVSEDDLRSAFAEMARWIRELPRAGRARAEERRAALAHHVLGTRPQTLAVANRTLASFLLRGSLSFAPRSEFASDLLAPGLVSDAVAEVIARIDDFIAVFNHAVEGLAAQDVDPMVKPLPDDYLPVHYSCPQDGLRRRLVHERRGADHFAVNVCPCGKEYRFHMGAGAAALGELGETDRWSPDVTLPVYVNGLVGGMVVGRSSALYGLVLNEVVAKVLGERPVPMLVPADLTQVLAAPSHPDSLLFDYLTGPEV
jgi:hypothetical protein